MITNLQLLVDSTPSLIHSCMPDGYFDFFNQRWLDFVDLSFENISGWKWMHCPAYIREWEG